MIKFVIGKIEIKYDNNFYTVIQGNGQHRKFRRWEKARAFALKKNEEKNPYLENLGLK